MGRNSYGRTVRECSKGAGAVWFWLLKVRGPAVVRNTAVPRHRIIRFRHLREDSLPEPTESSHELFMFRSAGAQLAMLRAPYYKRKRDSGTAPSGKGPVDWLPRDELFCIPCAGLLWCFRLRKFWLSRYLFEDGKRISAILLLV